MSVETPVMTEPEVDTPSALIQRMLIIASQRTMFPAGEVVDFLLDLTAALNAQEATDER